MSLKVGQQLGCYEVTSFIGKGGMGEVYLARDAKLGREVAIKALPEEFADDTDRLARFKREAQVLASLNHPNIAAIHALEESDGVHALVMELVEGQTLADRLKAGAVDIGEALSIARQMANALDAAHEKGIVHRDLKPANVKITPKGEVKILDFGLAKLTDPTHGEPSGNTDMPTSVQPTGVGVILGTAAYMSPEQARGLTVDKRADVWAFGCVFYELLTGQHPFKADTAPDVTARILEREPDWHALPANVPESIEKLLKRCLRKNAADRLRDIADARLEIDDVLTSSQRPPNPSPATDSFRVSRRTVSLGLTFAIVTVGLIVMFALRFLSTGPTADGKTVASESLPLVIMMDSSHPARVYDQETRAANGTNADVISDILSDLPIRRQKESIGPEWRRDEEIRLFHPDLILIHYSGFLQEAPDDAPRERLRLFIKFFATAQTKFVIYSRAREADLNANLSKLLADVYAEHPGLQSRIRAFGLHNYGPPRWINTTTATELKLAVKQILNLQ